MTLKYCGIVPKFTTYPASNRITVHIDIHLHEVTFDSIMIHSVIDSDKLVSYPLQSNNLGVTISIMRFCISQSYLLRYELQGEMYGMLNILCNILQYSLVEVYDGPGTLYSLLQPILAKSEMVLYSTTTFQCVIFICTKINIFSDTTIITFKTASYVSVHKEIFLQATHSKSITSSELKDTSIQILKIETQVELFLI